MSVFKPPPGGNPITDLFDFIRLANNVLSFTLMSIEVVKKFRATRKAKRDARP